MGQGHPKTTIPDSATYTYVPLEPRVAVRPYVVSLVGVRRYLRFKQTTRGLSFAEAAYIFKEKSTDAVLPQPPHTFFAAFTGMLLVKDFATGKVFNFAYANGIRQPYPAVPAVEKTAQRTTGCYTTITCDWTGTCATEPGNTPVYATSTYGLGSCTEPGDDGVGCSRIVWVLTRTNSQNHCSPDGSGDPGGDPNGGGTGGCTNCGPSGPTGPTPPTNLNSPCGKMYTLGKQSAFQQKSTSLVGMLTGKNEFMYMYRNGGVNGSDYIPIMGGPNSVGGTPPYQIDGDMHIHNLDATNQDDAALSIFSMDDLSHLYNLQQGNYMINPNTFTLSVFTAYGVDYAIKINDLSQFKDFGLAQLAGGRVDVVNINQNYLCPSCDFPMGEGYSKEVNEKNFLKFLKKMNTGLTLFKHDRASDTWQQKGIDSSNNPIDIPCQ